VAVALEAGYDLGALCLCFVAIALLLLAKDAVEQVISVLNVSIFGAHPFGGIARSMENTVLRVLNNAIKSVEALTAKFVSGLIDSLGIVVALPLLLAYGVKAALSYLWNQALMPRIHSVTDAISTTATKAWTHVQALENTVDQNLTDAETWATGKAAGALADAKAYANKWIDNAVSVLHGDIADALSAAQAYANTAIGKLRAAEDAAIATAVGIAAEAKVAGVNAAASALSSAEAFASSEAAKAIAAAAGALTTAEQYADARAREAAAAGIAAAAGVEQAVTSSLDVVRSIAIDAGHELHDLEGIYGALGTATLIASIPAIATIVNAIATEAGLENSSCRSKVKDVCRTDPTSWAQLLEGLAALGFAFNLEELYNVATGLVDELVPVIKQAA
jgi:hypothetical protein